ncbi:hypothetical protein [Thioclava sp. JE_KL1]|uniref:hypothetical protein n=1 Tax=Thioclava sp. JE_KL1 TaxID=2651187 RepID=UPI00128E6C69|nr:hypothetical protein [Thioclava sp. JE_KL1]MPQ96118.1 hypothetical protein [Thioclava sp. JE_KL1]
MKKPTSIQGYNQSVTEACERVLVTLIRHLGPWRDSIFLVGGLTPRYIIEERPPAVPVHAGTGDVDVVVDMKLLADIEAYRTLEDNIRAIGFTRSENDKGRGCVETRRRGLPDASFPHGSFFAAFDHSFARIAAW